jgi:hypothetical protein
MGLRERRLGTKPQQVRHPPVVVHPDVQQRGDRTAQSEVDARGSRGDPDATFREDASTARSPQGVIEQIKRLQTEHRSINRRYALSSADHPSALRAWLLKVVKALLRLKLHNGLLSTEIDSFGNGWCIILC